MPAIHSTQAAARRWHSVLLAVAMLGAALWLLVSTAAVAQTAPTVIHVDASASGANDGTSWSSAYTALQDAFAEVNASPGTDYQIWIASGVYYPDEGGGHIDDRRIESFTLRRDGVGIYGGFAGGESALADRDISGNAPVVLSGDIDHDNGGADVTNANSVTETAAGIQGDNSYHVLYFDGGGSADITADTVLDGVTVTAGDAGGPAPHHAGGGLRCLGAHSADNLCSPTITGATFAGNRAADLGGAVYNAGQRGGTSSPTITNAAFSGNRAGINGGAIYNNGIGGTSSPTIINVIFSGNQATYGGALYNSAGTGGTSSPTITQATFSGSRADHGAAIYNSASDGTSRPVISNAILYGNSTDDGTEMFSVGASPTLTHTIIEGGCPTGASCTAVIDDDPRFVNTANPAGADGRFATGDDGLRLSLASPARDRGDDALPRDSADLDGDGNTTEALPLDIVGADRIQGPHVDLGAYEAGAAYTIGGALSGLASGNWLTLRNNGNDDRMVTANGTFAFPARVPDGDSYAVTVATQPLGPNQTCTVANGSGTVSGTNVTTVEVVCQTDTHTIGGEVSGLDSGKSVVLADADSGQTVTVSADGSFMFPSAVADGSAYTVTISGQPAGQSCVVANGSGTVSGGDVADIQVTCAVNTHLVTVISSGDGKADPQHRTVTHGETAAFTFTPAENHRATIAGDCPVGRLVGTAYTTGAVTDACTVNVTFERIPPTLALAGGNGQAAALGKAFGEPLTVQVRDVDNTPVAGVTVTFTVTSGSAELSEQPMHTSAAPGFGLISTAVAQSAGASTVSVTTDADGRAAVYAAAGENRGAVAVTAEAAGVDEPVRFALSVGVTAVPVTGLPGLVVMAVLLFVLGGWMTHTQRQ